MQPKLRIGTRESALALWQARFVQQQLKDLNIQAELVLIKSDGEMDLVSPLYEMGVQGIFTRALDIALLQGKIDLAVHSLKDVPTRLPEGLLLAAVPERGNHRDMLIHKGQLPAKEHPYMVATSSLRRSAQWLNRYPHHRTDVLRGNINTRLQKLIDNQHWNGALFAAAGVERIQLEVPALQELDWMLPAPAQGALALVIREKDVYLQQQLEALNHKSTRLAVELERHFLRELMGGCSMPIAALATVNDNAVHFHGRILTVDGQQMAEAQASGTPAQAYELVDTVIGNIKAQGGLAILKTFKREP